MFIFYRLPNSQSCVIEVQRTGHANPGAPTLRVTSGREAKGAGLIFCTRLDEIKGVDENNENNGRVRSFFRRQTIYVTSVNRRRRPFSASNVIDDCYNVLASITY